MLFFNKIHSIFLISNLGVSIVQVFEHHGSHLIMLTLLSAMLAFCMEVSKYLVLQRTSSISVSVLGILQVIFSTLRFIDVFIH